MKLNIFGRAARVLLILFAGLLASACSVQISGCNQAETVCVDGVVVTGVGDGRTITAWETRHREFVYNEDGSRKKDENGDYVFRMVRSVSQETNAPTGQQALVAIAGTVPQAATTGAFGLAIARENAKGCCDDVVADGGGLMVTDVDVISVSDADAEVAASLAANNSQQSVPKRQKSRKPKAPKAPKMH